VKQDTGIPDWGTWQRDQYAANPGFVALSFDEQRNLYAAELETQLRKLGEKQTAMSEHMTDLAKFKADADKLRKGLDDRMVTPQEADKRLTRMKRRLTRSSERLAARINTAERRQVRTSQNAPRQTRTSTRPKGAREHQARGAKTSGGQSPGKDGDPDPDLDELDPVQRRIRELVHQAPSFSPGQAARLAQLLGGGPA
jgi:chromosome segregation ATPase